MNYRHKFFPDTSIEAWLAAHHEDDVYEENLAMLIAVLEIDFQIPIPEIPGYLERLLNIMISKGARPVSLDDEKQWVARNEFGANPNEIATNLMLDWVSSGHPKYEHDFGPIWLIGPHKGGI